MTTSRVGALLVAATLATTLPANAQMGSEQQSLNELRNTVINLLQTLVDQKVMTQEQAATLVKQAQTRAAEQQATADKRDDGAIRVPYVPQIVKDEISHQVAAQVTPQVVRDVVSAAKAERWGVPGALPEWMSRLQPIGDLRVRFDENLFGHNNQAFTVPDYNAINAAGGITQAGLNAFINTTNDTERLRIRARFGVRSDFLDSWSAAIRLSTGSLLDPSSESQTLGSNAARYTVGIDQAYIRYSPRDPNDKPVVTITAGRMPSPWFSPTELMFARDLGFEGISETTRLHLGANAVGQMSHVFATVGAFPMQVVPLYHQGNKWLLAGQLGVDQWVGSNDHLQVAAAYYDFSHISGILNQPGLSLTNFSAPPFIRYGNSYFDIANSLTASNNLFALASKFQVANLALSYQHRFDRYQLGFTAEGAKNVGFNTQDVFNRTGLTEAARNTGYVGELSFGDADPTISRGLWRTSLGYRYVQRDAVLDAWTDTDFHGGGTNARGVFLVGDLGLAPGVWLRVRYMNADTIDGPAPFSLDTLHIDLNAKF